MFVAAGLTIGKEQKQPGCPSMEEGVQDMVCTYLKGKGFLTPAVLWVKLRTRCLVKCAVTKEPILFKFTYLRSLEESDA